jgi:hypothetical protein
MIIKKMIMMVIANEKGGCAVGDGVMMLFARGGGYAEEPFFIHTRLGNHS